MSTKISGKEYQISQIFSSAFDFHIPSYQRPYAWGTEEAATLFKDLYGFYKSERSEENYFLGSTVLIKEEDRPKAGVIDGKVVSSDELIALAKLPSREVLIAQLAGALLGNISKLAVALDQVAKQKESAE